MNIPKIEEINFRAKMTKVQLDAIGVKLNRGTIISQLRNLKYLKDFRKCSVCDLQAIKKLLRNGWNTEYLLLTTADNYDGELLQHSLHWAFPQTYYSVFCICTAFLKVAGYNEESHKSVIKKVGLLMHQGKYPEAISFLCTDYDSNTYINISKVTLPSTIYFKPTPEIVNTQICQFLKATRKIDLNERKFKMGFKTKDKKNKIRLNPMEWKKVSDSIGYTNILNLLYRKRIKANYHEIDTLLSSSLNPNVAYNNLIHIVEIMNMVHEAFIIKGLGEQIYAQFMQGLNEPVKSRLEKRMLTITSKIFLNNIKL